MTSSKLGAFLFATGALLVGAIAQAQQTSQDPKSTASPTASSSATAPQPAAKADDKAASSQKAQAEAAKKAADQLVRDARNAGFKPETIRGVQMFCRIATELGSNFPVKTCYNEDQVRTKIQEYEAERQQMEQMHSNGVVGN